MFITPKIAHILFVRSGLFKQASFFSNLKDRFSQIKAIDHTCISQFYKELNAFEASLPHPQWVKFKKLIHESNKKVRRFNRQPTQNSPLDPTTLPHIPYNMDGSITCEYFYFKHTQTIYYKEQMPYHKLDQHKPKINTLPLHTLRTLVQQYLQNDLDSYLFNILPLQQSHSQIVKLVRLRFQAIQDILCRHIFQGYTEFTDSEENLFFKTQQKYKGKFKFQPLDPTASSQNQQTIHNFSLIAKDLACLNQCTSKVQLAVEMLLSLHWKSLDPHTLSNLLFCTSANGKDLHGITTNIDEFAARLLTSNQPLTAFNLLFYICVSGLESKQILDTADQTLSEVNESLNSYERIILSAMINYLSQVKQVNFVRVQKSMLNQFDQNESDCLKDFVIFLEEKKFKYQIIAKTDRANIIAPYKMVQIESKKFICYSSLFYQADSESNTLNGVAKMINEYFNACNEKIKIINGKKLAKMEKRLEKEEYLKTKMKGLTKPVVKKERKFDFYSPREDYFEKKDQPKK